MKKHLRALRFSVLSSLIAMLALLLFAVGASAHTAPSRDAASIPFAGAVSTSIVHSAKGPVFNPTSQHIILAHTSAIAVNNKTGRSQTVLDANGQVVFQLAPQASEFLSFRDPGTYVYHLQSQPKVTFTAIVS